MTEQMIERIVDKVDELMEERMTEEHYENLDIWGTKSNTVDDSACIIVEYPAFCKTYDVYEESESAISDCVDKIMADAEREYDLANEYAEKVNDLEDDLEEDLDEREEEEPMAVMDWDY